MEGLRGFAALLVFLVHFRVLFGHYAEGTALRPVVDTLGSLGHTGVDLFFILSGYLIYGIVMNRRFKFWRFFARRIRRLYPTFLAVFAMYVAASYFLPSRSKLPSSPREATVYLVANLLMLPGMLPIRPVITVAWSLSYEWFFYLLMPAIVALLRVRVWSWQWRTAFFVGLSSVLLGGSALGVIYNSRLILFGAGILLWEFLQRTGIPAGLPRSGEFVAAALFALTLLAVGLFGSHVGPVVLVLEKIPRFYVISLFASGLLFILYSISYRGFLGRIFSWDPLRRVGNMSYSYYLIHGLTLKSMEVVAQRAILSAHLSVPVFLLLFVSCLSATLITAGVLYLGIERPLSLAQSVGRTIAGSVAEETRADTVVASGFVVQE